jgi:hypothetical protein
MAGVRRGTATSTSTRVGTTSADPLSALEAVRQLQALVDEELLSQVGRARRRGVTWAGIADALGVSAQAVHKRFAWLV